MPSPYRVGDCIGRLTLVRRLGAVSGYAQWECRCTCGATEALIGRQIRRQRTCRQCFRRCVVCGAPIVDLAPQARVCGPRCKRILMTAHQQRTRMRQMAADPEGYRAAAAAANREIMQRNPAARAAKRTYDRLRYADRRDDPAFRAAEKTRGAAYRAAIRDNADALERQRQQAQVKRRRRAEIAMLADIRNMINE